MPITSSAWYTAALEPNISDKMELWQELSQAICIQRLLTLNLSLDEYWALITCYAFGLFQWSTQEAILHASTSISRYVIRLSVWNATLNRRFNTTDTFNSSRRAYNKLTNLFEPINLLSCSLFNCELDLNYGKMNDPQYKDEMNLFRKTNEWNQRSLYEFPYGPHESEIEWIGIGILRFVFAEWGLKKVRSIHRGKFLQ